MDGARNRRHGMVFAGFFAPGFIGFRAQDSFDITGGGAAHLLEEPDALKAIADLAIGWFGRYLR